jgi:itaconate CoA-transferase
MTKHEDLYRRRLTSPQAALRDLPKRCSVLLGIFSAQPPALVQALSDRAKGGEVDEALVYYMHATPATVEALIRPDMMDVIKLYPFFLGVGERGLVRQLNDHSRKVVHFVPNSFSEIPRIVRERPPFDVFLLQVSPMDRAGWFTFGPNGAYSLAGIERAKRIIVEVNPKLPRCHGTGLVHVSQVTAIVENASEIPAYGGKAPTDTDRQIAARVMPLIQDGACVQFGVGGVPNIIAGSLSDRKDLGVHTELISDGIANLIASGAVTNRRKSVDRGKSVFNVAFGSAATYDLIDDNPSVECRMADYVNDPRVIGANDNVVSVNAMIEVDLTGQCNAEYFAMHEYGGAGGHLDFVKGASFSRGGLSFIVGSATAAHGKASRIVAKLQGPATDPRIDTQYIVTEYGICNLRGMSSDERANAMIGLADPAFRDELTAAAREMHLI